MTTLGQEIITRYLETQKKVEAEIGSFPLPKLGDEVSLSDFIVLIVMEFSPLYKPDGKDLFKAKTHTLVRLRRLQLSDEQFDKAYPYIDEFLMWICPLLKERGG